MKTKTTFTPGPWTYSVTNEGNIGSKDKVRVECPDGHVAIACRTMQNNGRDTFGKQIWVSRALPEVKANARLIAAAPELLSALKGYLEQEAAMRTPGTWAFSRAGVTAIAAIAKAEGK